MVFTIPYMLWKVISEVGQHTKNLNWLKPNCNSPAESISSTRTSSVAPGDLLIATFRSELGRRFATADGLGLGHPGTPVFATPGAVDSDERFSDPVGSPDSL